VRGVPLVVSGSGFDSIVILGPTAAGKTSLAVSVARETGGEILSVDSRQVYRGLDIGSGKDLREYGNVPYHLIDVTDLSSEYSLFDFQRDFREALENLRSRRVLPVAVGGTGLYLDAAIRDYDLQEVPPNPALRSELEGLSLDELAVRLLSLKASVHNRTDLVDRERLLRAIEIAEYRNDSSGNPARPGLPGKNKTLRPLVLGVRFERPELRERIRSRLEERIREGLVDEVRELHEKGASWERLERLGLEYRFTARYLQGDWQTEREWFDVLFREICRFAKRQETWFRGMERKGVSIEWIDRGDRERALELVGRFFPLKGKP